MGKKLYRAAPKWNGAAVKFIEENYLDLSDAELAARLNDITKDSRLYTPGGVLSQRKKLGLRRSRCARVGLGYAQAKAGPKRVLQTINGDVDYVVINCKYVEKRLNFFVGMTLVAPYVSACGLSEVDVTKRLALQCDGKAPKAGAVDRDIWVKLYLEDGKTAREIAELYGVTERTVYMHMYQHERVEKSTQEYTLTIGGTEETKSLKAWEMDERCEVNAPTILRKVGQGITDERAIKRAVSTQNARNSVEACREAYSLRLHALRQELMREHSITSDTLNKWLGNRHHAGPEKRGGIPVEDLPTDKVKPWHVDN